MNHYILGDLVDEISIRENNPSTSQYERFVGLEHYVSGEIEIVNYGSTSNLNSAMKVFQAGDILVARRNVYLKRASVVYFDGLTSGDSIVLRAKDGTIGRILPFILNTAEFWDYADKHSDGTMSKRLSPKVLKSYEFDLPDENLDELADLLWSMVDTKKAYEELLKKTDELVKSQFIEMFGIPFKNEKQWPMSTLNDVCKYLTDGSHYSPKHDDNGDYPMMTVKNMTDNGFDYSDCKYIGESEYQKMISNGCKPLKNDILVAKDGSYFKTAFVVEEEIEQAVLSSIAILRPDTNLLVPRFLREYLMLRDVVSIVEKEYVTGTAIKRVILKKLKTMPIYVPTIKLQKQYVVFVNQIDKSKFEIQKAINGTAELIKSTLYNAIHE